MNSGLAAYSEVLRAALTQRSSLIEAALHEASRTLPVGTHVRALGRLALIVRRKWLRAWVRHLREKANGLDRIEFALAVAIAGDHPNNTAVSEIVLVSRQGQRFTLHGESPDWLNGPPNAANAPLLQLREITGLRWSSPQTLQKFVIELHELCLTLYGTSLCERAVRHLGQPLPSLDDSMLLNPAAGASPPRYVFLLR